MKKLKITIFLSLIVTIFLLLIVFTINISAQNNTYTIMFYNVENLFDTIDDPEKNDNSFLPDSEKKWNTKKYNEKLNNLAYVISSLDDDLPEIIGFAEVENKDVLEALCNKKLLKTANYKIIHYESSDSRGIDVALIYKADYFDIIYSQNVEVKYSPTGHKTRELLYVKGLTNTKENLHIFVNHWKSRIGDAEETEKKRIIYANIVKKMTDSILNIEENAKIIIMGDFNDNPDNKSICEALEANPISKKCKIKNKELYNMMYANYLNGEGTLYYKTWELYDQIIVSGNVFIKPKSLKKAKAYIFKPNWILTEKNEVTIPKSSYNRNKYIGGYSDHLPVYLEFRIR